MVSIVKWGTHAIYLSSFLFEFIWHGPLLIFVDKLRYEFWLGDKHPQLSLELILINKLLPKMCLETFKLVWFYIDVAIEFFLAIEPFEVFNIVSIVLDVKISCRIIRKARFCFNVLGCLETVTTTTGEDLVIERRFSNTWAALTSLIDHIRCFFSLIAITK